jgi:hypothetical protein
MVDAEHHVLADALGQAMLEVTARGSQVPAGILENRDLLRYSNGYRPRTGG